MGEALLLLQLQGYEPAKGTSEAYRQISRR